MSISKLRLNLLRLAPVFAFSGYGIWAATVNYYAGSNNFIMAGIIQGTYAFLSTLLLKLSVLKIHAIFKSKNRVKLMTYLVSFILMLSIPITIHLNSGTQEIFYSILPGVIIGSLYLFMIVRFEL